jgi:serine/threonine-protein kinase
VTTLGSVEHATTKPGTESASAAAAPARPAATTKAHNVGAPPLTSATAPRESGKDRRAREAREARESEARLAAARQLAAPPTGTVKIAISPWGLVEVDGTSSGAAPPITELTLAEGNHQIVIRNGDFAPYTAQIRVTAGQTVSLRHKFGS